jgi:organic radical activating enzyme
MTQREDYRSRRLDLLQDVALLDRDYGLELGAGDFQTVDPSNGNCEYGDYRSTGELADLFDASPDALAPVSHVLTRGEPISTQIEARFDYIILCHVLEHIVDPIGYLQDLAELLTPAGVVFLAIPDKRRTLDRDRPSTTLDVLLERRFMRASDAPLSQVMEFARSWLPEYAELAERAPLDFYEWACAQVESGTADVHCCVWEDQEFFAQIRSLIESQMLNGFSVLQEVSNDSAFNEFYLVLQRDPEDFQVEALEGRVVAGRSSTTRSQLYRVMAGDRHPIPPGIADRVEVQDIELISDAVLERIPTGVLIDGHELAPAEAPAMVFAVRTPESTLRVQRIMSSQANANESLEAHLDPALIGGGALSASHPLVRAELPAGAGDLPELRVGVEGEWVRVDPRPIGDGGFEIPLYAFFDRFDDQTHPLTIEMRLDGRSRSFELRPVWQRDEFIQVVSMDTTNTCNLRCAFCIEDQEWRITVLSPEILERVKRELFPATASDIMLSCLNEPFLNKNFHEVCRDLNERDARKAFFTSNMTIPLSDEKIEAVAAAPLKFINVSLDSSDPEIFEAMRVRGHLGVFEENLRKLADALAPYDDHELRFGAVITRLNFRTLPQTVEWAAQFRPRGFEFRSLFFANNWANTGWRVEDGVLEPDELAWLSSELHKACEQHGMAIHYHYETPRLPEGYSSDGAPGRAVLKTPGQPDLDSLRRREIFEQETALRAEQMASLSAKEAQRFLAEMLVRISATGRISFNDHFCSSFIEDCGDLREAAFDHIASVARRMRHALNVQEQD